MKQGGCGEKGEHELCTWSGSDFCCPTGAGPVWLDDVCQCEQRSQVGACLKSDGGVRQCESTVAGTNACFELVLCDNKKQGDGCAGRSASSMCSERGTQYCCPHGSPPVFVGGYCQCTDGPVVYPTCASYAVPPVPCTGPTVTPVTTACAEHAVCLSGADCDSIDKTTQCRFAGTPTCCASGATPISVDGYCSCVDSSTAGGVSTCAEYTESPTWCSSNVQGTHACTELAACHNTAYHGASCPPQATRCAGLGTAWCCPNGEAPYLLDGLCQCPSGTVDFISDLEQCTDAAPPRSGEPVAPWDAHAPCHRQALLATPHTDEEKSNSCRRAVYQYTCPSLLAVRPYFVAGTCLCDPGVNCTHLHAQCVEECGSGGNNIVFDCAPAEGVLPSCTCNGAVGLTGSVAAATVTLSIVLFML